MWVLWKLDEIFGTRPNNAPVVTADTLPPQPQLPSQLQSQVPLDPLVVDTLGSDEWLESDQEQWRNPRASMEVDEEDLKWLMDLSKSDLDLSRRDSRPAYAKMILRLWQNCILLHVLSDLPTHKSLRILFSAILLM
jgi:hypothetical protein